MSTYELMVIYPETLKEVDVKKHISALKDKIKGYKGKTLKEDYWGKKDFAYEMEKNLSGYYDVLEIEIDQSKIDGLTKWMNQQEDIILRSMLTKK